MGPVSLAGGRVKMAGLSRAYKRRGKGMDAAVLALAPRAWFDSVQPNALWQNTAQTIPAISAGNVIRSWSDRSGNGTTANMVYEDLNLPFLEAGHNARIIPRSSGVHGWSSGAKLDTAVVDTTGITAVTIVSCIRSLGTGGFNCIGGIGTYTGDGSVIISSGIINGFKLGAVMGGNPYTFIDSVSSFLATNLQTFSVRFDLLATTLETRCKILAGKTSGNPLLQYGGGLNLHNSLVSGFPITIFGRYDYWRFEGAIAEILFFFRSLSDSELNSVHAYLQSKWSVT